MITKILIYEEQKLFSGMLQFFINSQENLDVVETFDDFVFLMEFLKLNEVNVILFGINKVNAQTCILLDELKRTFNNLKIIVLNDGLEIKEARKLFKNGISGFVEKNSHNSELLKCIISVVAGNIYVDATIRERLFSDFFETSTHKQNQNVYQELTSREIDVLKLICEGYNSKEIADELFISINTVETHRKKIIQKFNVKNSIGIVRYAMQNNMI